MRSVLILLLAAPAAAEEITPIDVILKNKPAYEKKFSCVAGKTANLFAKVSRHKHAYFTVWIAQGEAKLKVFGYGKPPFVEGERIEACGVFVQERHHSSRIFYDELNAKTILRGDAIGAGRVVLTPTDVHLVDAKP